jgi:tetratricopeptide (TPR) repeat protein
MLCRALSSLNLVLIRGLTSSLIGGLAWGLIGGLLPAASAQEAPAPAPEPAPAAAPAAQDPPPRPSREATWPAPTAEDWKKPVLIHWQRTWEDAQAVCKETGKPLLVCVNMDGELASEHYAGIRYRQPEIAALYEQYVCVIASVYRHNARDFDEHGQRVPCPRFGTVTCGEHIAIEPFLYQNYFEGQRVAPRHVGLEDGKEKYDVFYALSTEAVFEAVRQGLQNRPPPPPPVDRGERTPLDLVSSRDSHDREAVEAAFVRADVPEQRRLVQAAIAQGPDNSLDLLRLALASQDDEVVARARAALAQSQSPAAVDLIVRALGFAVEAPDRAALVEALERLGESTPRARTLAVAYRGLTGPSPTIDVEGWQRALAAGPAAPSPAVTQAARLEQQDQILEADDPVAHVELAEALLAQARAERDPRLAGFLLRDAQRAAQEAEKLGAYGSRLATVLALTAYDLGDLPTAKARAEAALASPPRDPQSRDALLLLSLFAQSRQEAIAQAVRDKQDWPPKWLADVHAAWEVAALHPLASDSQVLMHHDFLRWFGANGEAGRVLEAGLQHFPASWDLHDRLRARVLDEQGVAGLEPEYERRLAAPEASPALHGFAGYAALVVAEAHRRAGRPEEAIAAYERAQQHYERALELDPDRRALSEHFLAMALAGRARVAFERGQDSLAVNELLAAFERRADASATADGLNITAVDTARLLIARLDASAQPELAARLREGLGKLDAVLLEPPVYERNQPGEPRNRSRSRNQGGAPRNP